MGFDINQPPQKDFFIRSEEVLLFLFLCVFLIYIKTHNRMEINL